MNCPVQCTPARIAALLCATVWFAFWLLPFRPAPDPPPAETAPAAVVHLSSDEQSIRAVRDPTLFALPSGSGFSGAFPAKRVQMNLTLEKPANPSRLLPRPPPGPVEINPDRLLGEEPRPQQAALPGVTQDPYRDRPPQDPGRIFLSPELEARAPGALRVPSGLSGLPETVRARLDLRADGTVERVLFQTPVDDPAPLISTLRQLRFIPADQPVSGDLSIRFVSEEESS